MNFKEMGKKILIENIIQCDINCFKEKKSEKKALNNDKKSLNTVFIKNDSIHFNDYKNKNTGKKRRRKSLEDYDIEEEYFKKLSKDGNENNEIKNVKKQKLENNTFISDKNIQHSLEKSNLHLKDDPEKALCTIFVGNLPISVISSKSNYKKLKAKFLEFGKIKSIRFRSIAFSELLPRKIAYIQKKFHSKRDILNAYIVYETKKSSEEALILNGTLFLDRHIRVDSVTHPTPHVPKRSIFIGNLSFNAHEEQLWSHFTHCGEIEFVRIVRDNKTNLGKGFAYVQFKNQESIDEALLLHNKEGPCGRKLRIVQAKNTLKKLKLKYKEKNKNSNLKKSNKDLPNKNMIFEGKRASKLDRIKLLTKKTKKMRIKNKNKSQKKKQNVK